MRTVLFFAFAYRAYTYSAYTEYIVYIGTLELRTKIYAPGDCLIFSGLLNSHYIRVKDIYISVSIVVMGSVLWIWVYASTH